MNVLIIQSDGAHKGQDGWTPNWYMRECYAIQSAFIANGHDCKVWGLRHDNFSDVPDFNSFDLVFCIENYETDWLPDFSKIRPFSVYWIIDLHCRDEKHYLPISKHCDLILHSTRRLINGYKRHGGDHVWFPNGVDHRFYFERNLDRTRDIIFVGSKNRARTAIIDEMKRDVGLEACFLTGTDMIDAVSSSKIHFNKNIGCDVNYRTFETIGLGACLITDYNDELVDLGFIDGSNCLMYKNVAEAKDKVRHALRSGDWDHIRKSGNRLADNHTYNKRISDLLAGPLASRI